LRGIIKFLVFSTLLVALLVFIGVPLLAGPLLAGMARDAGLEGDGVEVSVNLLGPGLFSGRASEVRVRAEDVTVPRAMIGRLDLTLHGVSPADRTFESVTGHLEDVRVSGPGGLSVMIRSVDLDGPAETTRARGELSAEDSEVLVAQVARDAGLTVDRVRLEAGGLLLIRGEQETQARFRVAGAALILETDDRQEVVVAPVPSEPWRLETVSVTQDGLAIELTVDVRRLADIVRLAGEG